MIYNERTWTGQLLSWIKQAINEGRTVFQDVTNDEGIKLKSGKTKFPDILLFTDKVSGIVFNGWELKFPDTAVDDSEMLLNALEKAERLQSDSFVTWNGTSAIIWKIENKKYAVENLVRIKEYPKEDTINTRDDLANPKKYKQNEQRLIARLNEILHDLEQLLEKGVLRQAINITGNFIEAIKSAAEIIIPQFEQEIVKLKGSDTNFRNEFNRWKIYENSTLTILRSSSRRSENINEEEILAKFAFYNLTGKILFYLTLAENLSGELNKINLINNQSVKTTLCKYFDDAQKIDYQAVFQPYFTDIIEYSKIVNDTISQLFETITEFDFKILPTTVIGTVLENLVPKEEKQKFGQYFTPELLANFVTFPVVKTVNDIVFDPTSGTGTLLNAFYNILSYHGNTDHSKLLNQIWGNDIAHFPAIFSVINLYKQKVNQTDNFPRITRKDFFNLHPNEIIIFPDSNDFNKQIEIPIPKFDGIASNFPFIQQEDIPRELLTAFFGGIFNKDQDAFVQAGNFKINERSDYFTFCIYNSIRFINDSGILSAITSNAWLGKEYGIQFKKFLLDNFHIKYVIRSSAEHWFSDSKVSTIFTVLQKGNYNNTTKFVTINLKLEEYIKSDKIENQLKIIEEFYVEVDNCDDEKNNSWQMDTTFDDLYHKSDDSISVNIVSKEKLIESLSSEDNWSQYFISANLFNEYDNYMVSLYPSVIDVFRGERTGWNDMFIIPESKARGTGIEEKFLVPYLKSSHELQNIEFISDFNYFLFVCSEPIGVLREQFPGAYNWINRFENTMNKNHTKTIREACSGHIPYWYSLRPKSANIITTINPYERLFFCFSENAFTVDQRLIAININDGYDVELITALFNSIITFLTIEMRGTPRNLGVLDLNANYFKQLKVLNPDLLSVSQIKEIKDAFEPLKLRPIETIFEEVKKDDRINFDKTVLKSFGFNDSNLSGLYKILTASVKERVTMKEQ